MKTISRLFLLLAVLVASAACEEGTTDDFGSIKVPDLVVTFDKSVIKASGSDVVTFKAFYKGTDVTSQTTFLLSRDGNFSPGKYEVCLSSFSTDKIGTYYFKAGYNAGESDILSISAIARDIPAAAVDKQAGNTSFVRRTFFNQHTGTQCPNCPFMTYLIRKTLTDEVKDKVVFASVRNYSGETGFANIQNPASSWPYLHIDYSSTYPYNGTAEGLQAKINEWTSAPAKVGISANPVFYEDGQIIVKVTVKAAETDEYNVGLWLMQDNFYKKQLVDNSRLGLLEGTWGDSYHYHDNCVRVAESKYLGSHVGYPLGKIEAGKTAEWIFLVNVNLGTEAYSYTDRWWDGKEGGINLNDLHFAAFVTTHKGTKYTVVNAIDFKYNESKSFEYK